LDDLRALAINPPVPTVRRSRRASPRVLVALLAAALAPLAASASARASSGARVHLGSRVVTIPGSQVAEGDVALTYTVQGSHLALHGTSIRALLTEAGADPTTVSSVSVGGTSLSAADIGDPPPFPEGPALVTVVNGKTRFLRPESAPGAGDAVYIETPVGQPIDVVVSGARQSQTPAGASGLQVIASASPTQASAGQLVSFTALVENPPPGAGLNYSWSFGDGGSAYGAAPNHSYGADGDYPVSVTVSAGQGASANANVEVHVGHPHRRGSGSGLGSTNATGSGGGGTGTGKGGTGGGSGTGAKGATQPKAPPKPAVKAAPQTPQPVGAAVKPASAPPSPGGSQAVHGLLLADAGSPLDLRLSPPPPPSGSPGASHKSVGGSSGLAAVLGGLALALAIATLGAMKERRRGTIRIA
jgi:hypothetical protein